MLPGHDNTPDLRMSLPPGITARGGRLATGAERFPSARAGSELETVGKGHEQLLQALQCADVPVAGGRLLEPEHLGGLGVAELLKVSQYEDLAIDRIHAVE